MKKYLLFLMVFIAGCTNTVEKFYTGISPEESINLFGQSVENQPILIKTNNVEDLYNIAANRYVVIGSSKFNASNIEENEAIKFGRKINAEIVTISSIYTHTEQFYVPITTPNFSDTHTSINNGYGYTIGSLDSSTTSYSTQYIPSSARRYDYNISFWRKIPEKLRLGIKVDNLNNQEREEIETNKGIIVFIVYNDSVAFKNDILRGDIITKVNGKEIYNIYDFFEYMDNFKGKTITLDIIRKKKHLKKTLKLGEEK